MSTSPVREGTLPVPGATLRYEIRGNGPLLLLIPGGAGGSAAFEGVAAALADRFTVASYDPRGIGASPLDVPGAEQQVAVHAADAHCLLELLSPAQPGFVCGTSSGGIVAAELLARHPERVRLVVAHEPPLGRLAADPETVLAGFAEVGDIAVREGVGPGYARLGAVVGEAEPLEGDEGDEGEPEAMSARLRAVAEASSAQFLQHVLKPFTHHAPDLALLKAAADRLVVGVGRSSRGQLPHTLGAALAESVGAECRIFPGGHVGCVEYPGAFARELAATLR
ncbi:alpha/beta fold hydrolase [Streptomyces oryzae]|uniref:Alpha/beta fold hydrolase n=1 Tax=Streptomyces oryzae TaxID=1434886 RepID=A0ABS3XD48_9ACTN|nr:alpha/beta hydrolase [Streptomyces oryzae]MBO8193289.1 alpha/beta fold hydrolase [Streptomyces oryzae]